jgi:hypothetical protein
MGSRAVNEVTRRASYVTFTFAKPKVKRTLAEQPEARSVTFTFANPKVKRTKAKRK